MTEHHCQSPGIFNTTYIHHMGAGVIFKFVFFVIPGLPDWLPDAVCPAAMLQHVYRPPQQQWETNPTVHRPLAWPQATQTQQTCSLGDPSTSTRDASAIMKKEREENWGRWMLQREEPGLEDNDMHLPAIPISVFSWDGGHEERERLPWKRSKPAPCFR